MDYQWKSTTHKVLAMREAEKQAEQKRIAKEQLKESIKNGKIIRSLERSRDVTGRKAKAIDINDKRIFDYLYWENINQMKDQLVSNSTYHQRQDNQHHQMILKNIEEVDAAEDEAKQIRAAMNIVILKEKETEKAIEQTKAKLNQLEKKMDLMRVLSEGNMMRRIELWHQKFGLQLTENRSLVDQIKHLRMEQASKREVHDSLRKELAHLSKQLMGHIEKAQTKYEARDLNRRSLARLKEHMEKRTQGFESDMQMLQFKIDVLKRLERFITTKNKFRPDMSKERRKAKAEELSAPQKDNIVFAKTMEQITEDLQEVDLFAIIKTFRELEEENYNLFQNITYTRDACHIMQAEIDFTEDKIGKLGVARSKQAEEFIAHRKELREKIDICKKAADAKEACVKECARVIGVYIDGTLSILKKMGYTSREIEKLGGIYKGIDEHNIRSFLGLIENYVNKLDGVKSAKELLVWNNRRRMSINPLTVDKVPPRLTVLKRLLVVPPSFDDAEDAEDPELPAEATFRPFNVNEMKSHVDACLDVRKDDPRAPVPPPPNMTDTATACLNEKAPKKEDYRVDVF